MNCLKNNRGFSLVELLTVMIIAPILIMGVYAGYLGMQQTYSTQNQVVDMQRNARAAMHELVQTIREAGYGMSDLPDIPIWQYNGSANSPTSLMYAINTPGGALFSGDLPLAGTDGVDLYYDTSSPAQSQSAITIVGTNAPNSANTKVSDASSIHTGDFIVIFDVSLNQAILYQATNVNGSLVLHSPGGSSYNPPGGVLVGSIQNWGPQSQVLNLNLTSGNRISYYIDSNYNLIKKVGKWSTIANAFVFTSHIIAANIEDMEVEYTFRDGSVRHLPSQPTIVSGGLPVQSDPAHDPAKIRAIAVSIIARTAKPDPKYTDTTAYQLKYGSAHSGGGYRRMILTGNIALRNLMAKDNSSAP